MLFQVEYKDDVIYLFMEKDGFKVKYLFKLTKDNVHGFRYFLIEKRNTLFITEDLEFVFSIVDDNVEFNFETKVTEKERKQIEIQFVVIRNLLDTYIENLEFFSTNDEYYDLYQITNRAKKYLDQYVKFLRTLNLKSLLCLVDEELENPTKEELIKNIMSEILMELYNEVSEINYYTSNVSITESMVKKMLEPDLE